MSEITPVDSIRFVTDELAYVEAGRDYRAGIRLYESAVTGQIQLRIDDARLFVADIAPATFTVSETVRAMYRLCRDLETSDTVRTTPFCCVCGSRACAYIRWELERTETGPNSSLRLTITDLTGNPIGDHRYGVDVAQLRDAVADLAHDVVTTLQTTEAAETDAGTIAEFREREAELRRWRSE